MLRKRTRSRLTFRFSLESDSDVTVNERTEVAMIARGRSVAGETMGEQ